ncbi:STAS domain-containing protein [Streptomyces sp. NPDC048518]|uniref:STAS domain-containing protein n=1 Tax=Streptomyces sp. NPDC048518 TaxID=3155029 RepID=UPI0033C24975
MGRLVIHRTEPGAGHFVTLTLIGELEVTNISGFNASVVSALKSGRPHLLVDLDGITRCDNGSLYTLLGAQQAAGRAGGSLTITAASTTVRDAIQHNGLQEILPVTPR